ncbi:hypothetical protein [Paenibacillus popilliae]|uniref:hypothetical protein n=1 Tax=Paenibacillus popilliae TaxID=78057 RepID=UPI0005A9DE44|nr:hypothetical protein [Paenibacillus popilliae]
MKKELVVIFTVGALLLSGSASAFTAQSSSVRLGSGSKFSEGAKINGTDSEHVGRLTGKLVVAGGQVSVEAMKQISYWPDSSVDCLIVDSTTKLTKEKVILEPYDSLYYVKIISYLDSPTATGTLYNYGGNRQATEDKC